MNLSWSIAKLPVTCCPGGHSASPPTDGDIGAIADGDLAQHRRARPNPDVIPDRHAAGDHRLGRQETTPADLDVMGDMHEIIALGVFANLGEAAEDRTIHAGVGLELDTITQAHPTGMSHRQNRLADPLELEPLRAITQPARKITSSPMIVWGSTVADGSITVRWPIRTFWVAMWAAGLTTASAAISVGKSRQSNSVCAAR